MNKQKKGFIHIGFSSILMVFTMLCLVTFATLSLITANSDYRLSLKVAEKTTAYYEADTAARNYLQQLDLALADLYANCDDLHISGYDQRCAESLCYIRTPLSGTSRR